MTDPHHEPLGTGERTLNASTCSCWYSRVAGSLLGQPICLSIRALVDVRQRLAIAEQEVTHIVRLRVRRHPCQVDSIVVIEVREDEVPDAGVVAVGSRGGFAAALEDLHE